MIWLTGFTFPVMLQNHWLRINFRITKFGEDVSQHQEGSGRDTHKRLLESLSPSCPKITSANPQKQKEPVASQSALGQPSGSSQRGGGRPPFSRPSKVIQAHFPTVRPGADSTAPVMTAYPPGSEHALLRRRYTLLMS